MKKQELSPQPLIKPYHKEGLALHAEETVQALLDAPYDTPEIIKRSNHIIDSHFNSSVTGEYKKAGWRAKIGMAAVGHLVVRAAMMDILNNYQYFGSLSPPSLTLDTLHGAPSNLIEKVDDTSFWLRHHTKHTLNAIHLPNNAYRSLYGYFKDANLSHHICQRDWRAGAGKDRWPSGEYPTFDDHERLADCFLVNGKLAVSLLCTKAIHHLVHKNSNAGNTELYQASRASIEQISWQTSGSRHYGWAPDWREREARNEHLPGTMPRDGMTALLTIPPSQLTLPNNFMASRNGSTLMQDPDFCIHPALRDGPSAHSALCAGDTFVRQTHRDDRDLARAFFGVLDMHPDNGDCYSLGGIALAMGGVTLKNIVLPALEVRRRKEAEGNL